MLWRSASVHGAPKNSRVLRDSALFLTKFKKSRPTCLGVAEPLDGLSLKESLDDFRGLVASG